MQTLECRGSDRLGRGRRGSHPDGCGIRSSFDRVAKFERRAGNFRTLPFLFPMALRLGIQSLSHTLGRRCLRHRNYSIQQLPGDYSVVFPKEPFVWGVSHIIPRPVPVHIPRPPYIKGDRPILDDSTNGDPYEGDGRIELGSPEEQSLRNAALLARDALRYASTLAKVINILTIYAQVLDTDNI